MSIELIIFAQKFVVGDLSAEEFADPYIAMWSSELNLNTLKDDSPSLSECASSIFILADCFNPELDRWSSELDEDGLRVEVRGMLEKFGFI